MQLSPGGDLDGEQIADIDACAGCHGDVYDQLQTSAHALSSFNNPLYRFAIDGFRKRVGKRESQLCGGCHDVALLVDDALVQDVDPDDNRAHAGITCRVCHGIEAASVDGNASYTLSSVALPVPGRDDPASVVRHQAAVKPLADEALCGSCHRSFLSPASGNDHFLSGMDDFGAWRSSAYNRSGAGRVDEAVPAATCRDCHMAREPARLGDVATGEDGKVASHRFLGGHTWLAAMRGDDAQLARLRDFLRGTVSVDLAAARSGDGPWYRPAELATAVPGETLSVDVVVRNVGVGHAFPGGVRDAVDSWLAIEVRDADGGLIADSRDGEDAHRFRVLVGNRHGQPQLRRNTEDFYEAVVDQTLPARDVRVIRYAIHIPAALTGRQLPLEVRAVLLHRSRNLEFQTAVCEASTSPRSRAFARARTERLEPELDPCAPQPVSVIGEARVRIGAGARSGKVDQPALAKARAKRLYEHGLGLLAELPLEASNARASLLSARQALAEDRHGGGPEGRLRRAQIEAALGAVYAGAPCGPSAAEDFASCAGNVRAALQHLDAAERDAPGHPAIANIRARAQTRRLLWSDALTSLRAVASAVPENVSVLRTLSMTLGGLGMNPEALAVASHGLGLAPRDGELLRIQARALTALGAGSGQLGAAWAAYEAHRRADRPTAMRALCMAHDPRCRLERRAVHTHLLETPGATYTVAAPVHVTRGASRP